MNIGYLHIRSVDAIRYPIYNENNEVYFIYNNKKCNINFNFIDLNNNFIVLDKSINYNDYVNNALNGFKNITINGVNYLNNNIINFKPNDLKTTC